MQPIRGAVVSALDIEQLKTWIGRTLEAEDDVTPRLVESYRAIFEAHLAPVGGGAAPPGASPPRAPPSQRPASHASGVDPTPVMLFRYSAITFNGHRIHYDAPYATTVEGYEGLVVHGPLQATLLLNLAAVIGGQVP